MGMDEFRLAVIILAACVLVFAVWVWLLRE